MSARKRPKVVDLYGAVRPERTAITGALKYRFPIFPGTPFETSDGALRDPAAWRRTETMKWPEYDATPPPEVEPRDGYQTFGMPIRLPAWTLRVPDKLWAYADTLRLHEQENAVVMEVANGVPAVAATVDEEGELILGGWEDLVQGWSAEDERASRLWFGYVAARSRWANHWDRIEQIGLESFTTQPINAFDLGLFEPGRDAIAWIEHPKLQALAERRPTDEQWEHDHAVVEDMHAYVSVINLHFTAGLSTPPLHARASQGEYRVLAHSRPAVPRPKQMGRGR
ncbi:hypothetical protein ACWGJ9_11900 [Curtobacterium citreum]